MGSKSHSTTSSTQNTSEVTTSLGDNRVTDTGNIGGNVQLGETHGNIAISTTDYGAIESGQVISMAALDFGGDAVEGAFGIAEEGFDLAADTIVSSQELAEQAIDLTGSTFAGALSTVNSNSKFFQQQTAQTVDRALAFATRADTSEGAQVLQDGLKYAAIVAGIAGLAYVMRGAR